MAEPLPARADENDALPSSPGVALGAATLALPLVGLGVVLAAPAADVRWSITRPISGSCSAPAR